MNEKRFWQKVVDGVDDAYISEAANIMYKGIKRRSRTIEVDFAKIKTVEEKPRRFEKLRAAMYAAAAVALIVGAGFLTKFIIDNSKVEVEPPANVTTASGVAIETPVPDGAVFPECEKVFDILFDENDEKSGVFEMPEYPDCEFKWNAYENITKDGKDIFLGMPVMNLYLADITGDGKRELCCTASSGSGIIDMRVYAYDCDSDSLYELCDRGNYDYIFAEKDGTLRLRRYSYPFESLKGNGGFSELVPDISLMERISDGITSTPDEFIMYEPMGQDSLYFDMADILDAIPEEAADTFKKAWNISAQMAYPTTLIKYPAPYLKLNGKTYFRTDISADSFDEALSETFAPAAKQKMQQLFPHFISFNNCLWVEEVVGDSFSVGRKFDIIENRAGYIEILRSEYRIGDGYSEGFGLEGPYYDPEHPERYDADYTRYYLVNSGDLWKADVFLYETPNETSYDFDDSRYKSSPDMLNMRAKLVEWNKPYWVLEGSYDKYDYVKYMEGRWYSFRTKETSVYNDALDMNGCRVGEVNNVGSDAHPTANDETNSERRGTIYSNKRKDYYVEDEQTVLLAGCTMEDYERFKSKYDFGLNDEYFLAEVLVVIPCEPVSGDEMSLFFKGAPDTVLTGEMMNTDELHDLTLDECLDGRWTTGDRNVIYGWRDIEAEYGEYGTHTIGKFLEGLGDPELTDAYFKASVITGLFDTENFPIIKYAGSGAKLHVRNEDRYDEFSETGYTYDSFYKVLTDTFTKKTADILLERNNMCFMEYGGELWYIDRVTGGRLGLMNYDYEIIERTDNVIEFRRTDYDLLNWKDFSNETKFHPDNPDEYKLSYVDFRFVKTDDGWRAEKFNNITDYSKNLYVH